ncbi:olfactory receptor 2A5-like [Hyla sarda]|uniref:olfactory receptor 2A5-like n=1 Tax=Hyla sarda TaxID=327740 RepID=UPI0024C286B6|nr:olfactory receptor 2A5-like [Hyla sarda]
MDLPINRTLATEVILLGFPQDFIINVALFLFFSVVYLVTIVGNGFMVCVIVLSRHLHTPMYFFLGNLSFIDIIYSSRTLPKLLTDLLSSSRTISLTACGFQAYAAVFLGSTECLLLALMAYDRYVAICRPLNYVIVMRWSICYRLTAIVWASAFTLTVVLALLLPVKLCNPNQINHFACEVLPAIKLSCDSTDKIEIVLSSVSFITIFFPFAFILLSYIVILSSVLKIHSAARSKAFSTCSSHITVVALFYGTLLVIFAVPPKYTSAQEKYTSIFTSILIPMINPLTYSLKNKDVNKIFVMKSGKIPRFHSHG